MITFKDAKALALKENKGFVVTNAAQYKNLYVFFLQPEGVKPESEEAWLDSYEFVNIDTGELENHSLMEFEDFFDKAEELTLSPRMKDIT